MINSNLQHKYPKIFYIKGDTLQHKYQFKFISLIVYKLVALREFAWSKASVTESIDPVNIAFCRQHSPLEMDDHPDEQMNQSSLELDST
jgi:hypothetical protein